MILIDNPEFKRLVRTKLRVRALITYIAVAVMIFGGVLAFSIYIEKEQAQGWRGTPFSMPRVLRTYFFWVAGIQLTMVALYGVLLAAQNVTLEKEKGTFDFQRLVAMGPLRLAIGKLFGASVEAQLMALAGVPFAIAAFAGSDISASVLLQTELIVFVFALATSSFGLMCSSIAAKTSQATSLVVLFGLPAGIVMTSWQSNGYTSGLWGTVSPAILLREFSSTNYAFFLDTFQFCGVGVPMIGGFLCINLLLIALGVLITSRRIADVELSFLTPLQGMLAFVLLQVLLIGDMASNTAITSISGLDALKSFHLANMVALVLMAFALTPGAELVRGRVFRSKRDEHWKIVGERTNRLQDSPALRVMFEICGIYFVSAAIHALFLVKTANISGVAYHSALMSLMVAMIAIAVTGLLLYIQVCTEQGSLKIGIVLVLFAFVAPPMVVGAISAASPTVHPEHMASVSPVAYIVNTLGNTSGRPTILNSDYDWTCPIACSVVAAGFVLLSALRIRFLLDVEDIVRKREPAPRGPTLASRMGQLGRDGREG